jgi:hypothetical protein
VKYFTNDKLTNKQDRTFEEGGRGRERERERERERRAFVMKQLQRTGQHSTVGPFFSGVVLCREMEITRQNALTSRNTGS